VSVKRTNLSHSRQLFNTLIPPVAGGLSVAYTVLHCAGLVTPECNRGVIDPLYHSRHNGRDRQYECDRGISMWHSGAKRQTNLISHSCLSLSVAP